MNSDNSRRTRWAQFCGHLGSAAVVFSIMAAGWWAVHSIDTGQEDLLSAVAQEEEADSRVLTLPEAKIAAAGLDTQPVQHRPLQHLHTVPGRIRYNDSKHIEIKAPIDGILTQCLVMPGDRVSEGQLLAVIHSPEVGRARADVLKFEAELALVERQANWQRQVTNNLAGLFSELESGRSLDEIEAIYAEKPLGQYRDQLLSNWSKKGLAERLAETARPLVEQGSIAGRTYQQRETDRHVAASAYRTVRDQARFESRQEYDRILNELADARRRVAISRHHLETLLGYPEKDIPTDTSGSLSRLEVRAPFCGTIESRTFASSERVSHSEAMFVLADTSSLYVAASIRENDWPAISLEPGQKLTVTAPAVSDRSFCAEVYYIERQVDVDSNSVPLIAKIDNHDGTLRPGMFVRVSIPLGQPQQAVAVRPRSVMQHENNKFVFVAMNDRTFRRVDVVTGVVTDDWVEIRSGLEPGQRVVDDGAFLLKSELLLEGEGE